jgi:HSP20 family protein
VNITETDEAYTIDVAAPGLEKKDFSVTIDDHPSVPSSTMRGVPTLTISASKESKSDESTGKVNRREFSYANFKRMFTLPDNVQRDKVTSTYENGILHLVLPKTEESKPKSVEVKVN